MCFSAKFSIKNHHDILPASVFQAICAMNFKAVASPERNYSVLLPDVYFARVFEMSLMSGFLKFVNRF